MSQKLSVGQLWVVWLAQWSGDTPPGELVVLTLEVGAPYDKGFREVECLVLEGALEGTTVKLSNGAFNAPNKRVA